MGIRDADFHALAREVRNWGRWGEEDELGTLNFISAELVRASADLVRTGQVISLATAIQSDGIWPADYFRRNAIHLMTVDGGDAVATMEAFGGWGSGVAPNLAQSWQDNILRFTDDYVIMPLQCASHWDALAHVYYDNALYNGFPASSVSSFGASRNSVARVAERGLVGRGVLLDVARHRGMEVLPPGASIMPDELSAVAVDQGVSIGEGDVLLIRTGWWGDPRRRENPSAWFAAAPGLDWTTAEWLSERRVAALASDNLAVETSGPAFDSIRLPLHLLCLRDMGLMLGELWNLDALAKACAADGVYDFQLQATPLNVTGSVGAPVSPVAVR